MRSRWVQIGIIICALLGSIFLLTRDPVVRATLYRLQERVSKTVGSALPNKAPATSSCCSEARSVQLTPQEVKRQLRQGGYHSRAYEK